MKYLTSPSTWDLSDPTSFPNLFFAHVSVTVLTLVISLAIAFPVSLLIVRYHRLDLPVQTFAGILYTIPSLAFIAIMIPFTGLTMGSLLVPLVAYAQVVLIRNIVAAIRAVDPVLVDVGRAMGMTRRQTQWRVVLPLALPVIVAGVRVVTVTTIGIATLGPFVGFPDLGTIIFEAIEFEQYEKIATGAVIIAIFAIAVDLALLGLQRWLSRGQAVASA